MSSVTSAVKATQPRAKHVPKRTCVSCRSTTAKRELIRLIRTPEGGVEPDPTGKRPGRGAYLCHNPQCWDRAVKKDRLENALRVTLSADARAALLQYKAERLGAEAS